MNRKPPMTAKEAREIVAVMLKETPRDARRKLWQTALKLGNLSADAKAVYRTALAADQ